VAEDLVADLLDDDLDDDKAGQDEPEAAEPQSVASPVEPSTRSDERSWPASGSVP